MSGSTFKWFMCVCATVYLQICVRACTCAGLVAWWGAQPWLHRVWTGPHRSMMDANIYCTWIAFVAFSTGHLGWASLRISILECLRFDRVSSMHIQDWCTVVGTSHLLQIQNWFLPWWLCCSLGTPLHDHLKAWEVEDLKEILYFNSIQETD